MCDDCPDSSKLEDFIRNIFDDDDDDDNGDDHNHDDLNRSQWASNIDPSSLWVHKTFDWKIFVNDNHIL